jgi:hypothetical protein
VLETLAQSSDSVVECLLLKCEALISNPNPSPTKKEKREKEKGREERERRKSIPTRSHYIC